MEIINQPINESFIEDYEALKLHLKKSEFRYEQLVNYLTAKLGTKGEHGVFETIDNVAAKLAGEAQHQESARWRKAASPVTDNLKEDAGYQAWLKAYDEEQAAKKKENE